MAEHRSRIRILIADDHPLLREGLRKLIETQRDMTVVGEAGDGEQALLEVQRCNPDVLLLDLAMPRLSGLDTLKELFKARSPVKTIILTAAIEEGKALEALRCGAHGIVLKDSATQSLFKAVRAVVAGEYWVGRDRIPLLVDALRTLTQRTTDHAQKNNFGLTPRELQIVGAILAGSTNRAIAAEFHISDQTVKNHLTAIFNKIGVSNRLELALFAAKHDLVDHDL